MARLEELADRFAGWHPAEPILRLRLHSQVLTQGGPMVPIGQAAEETLSVVGSRAADGGPQSNSCPTGTGRTTWAAALLPAAKFGLFTSEQVLRFVTRLVTGCEFLGAT
jgi:hypothetical protein